MFSLENTHGQSRVLIASDDAEQRRNAGEIARAAGMRAIGFVREAEQVGQRSVLSAPDILLLDLGMAAQMHNAAAQIRQASNAGAIRIVLFGDATGAAASRYCRLKGVSGTLELHPATQTAQGSAERLKKLLGGSASASALASAVPLAPAVPVVASGRRTLQPISVVIGASTGGPVALMEVLRNLPADFPLPVAVVQHMPPNFTRMLAERLDAECPVKVVEAESGMPFTAGTVFIAPGGFHMVLEGTAQSARVRLNKQPPENSCRPAVDVLFRSSAAVYGGRQHAIVLSGMGRDGLLGATMLHGLGTRIVVQDAVTSIVWGMPGSIAQAGIADDILPIDKIAPHLMRCI